MKNSIAMVYLLAAAACTTANSGADSTKTSRTDSANMVVATDDNAGQSAVNDIRAGWKAAADKKDSTAVANYYADDAVMAVSEAPAAIGRAAIEKALGRMVNLITTNSIDSKQLVVRGDEAYDYGTYAQTATMPNGKSVNQTGYYIVTLHRGADGAWKITHHVAVTPPAPS